MLALRRLAAALALTVLAVPAVAQDQTLTVYTSQHQALTQAWADAFTAKTGVQVAIRKGTDILMANQIIQEGLNSPADIFLTENSPAMTMVEEAGLFSAVAPATLEQVPEEFRPKSGMWTGIAARTTVFVYNTEMLKDADLPKSMLDLAKPEWQGRWGAAPAGADFQAIVSALLQLEGTDETANWLAGLKKNAITYRGNFEAMRGANMGEVAGALIYNYYFHGDKAATGESSNKLKDLYFGANDPGGFVSISGGGVLAASDTPELAQQFLAFVTSAEGQQVLAEHAYEYTVGSGVAANSILPPLDTIGYPKVDPSLLNAQEVVQLMTASGVM